MRVRGPLADATEKRDEAGAAPEGSASASASPDEGGGSVLSTAVSTTSAVSTRVQGVVAIQKQAEELARLLEISLCLWAGQICVEYHVPFSGARKYCSWVPTRSKRLTRRPRSKGLVSSTW